MLDFNASEFLVVGIVALLVIGPKDLPKAMRFVGQWVGKARGVARQFRSGFDTMLREAELADLEKKWAEENARIMQQYPTTPDPVLSPPDPKPVDPEAEAARRDKAARAMLGDGDGTAPANGPEPVTVGEQEASAPGGSSQTAAGKPVS